MKQELEIEEKENHTKLTAGETVYRITKDPAIGDWALSSFHDSRAQGQTYETKRGALSKALELTGIVKSGVYTATTGPDY